MTKDIMFSSALLTIKAFDNIRHDIKIIKELYWQQSAEIRINNDLTTDNFAILRGVRQGCVLSPILFNMYVNKIF